MRTSINAGDRRAGRRSSRPPLGSDETGFVGSTLAVGAPFEGSAARGIAGDQADNSVQASDAVYVLTRGGNAWSQQAYV